jgi:hypothetical protein
MTSGAGGDIFMFEEVTGISCDVAGEFLKCGGVFAITRRVG